jgi:hypothetical protein
MANDMRAVIAGIADLLRKQRNALRSGDFPALGTASAEITALLERLEQISRHGDEHELARLRNLADANRTLIVAARQGVHAARERLGAIVAAGVQLKTYDSRGRSSSLSCFGGSIERRT